MVTEPLEALIALLLISIILASIFVYNQRGTEKVMMRRTFTRSIAGTVSGFYLYYLNTTQGFDEFNRSVANFLAYVDQKEGVSCSATLEFILKNGSIFDYSLVKGRKLNTTFKERITVAYGNISGNLHVYAIPNRTYISLDLGSDNPFGVYLIGYYDNGVSAIAGDVDNPPQMTVVYQYTYKYWTILGWKTGTIGPKTDSGSCNPFFNGRATCYLSPEQIHNWVPVDLKALISLGLAKIIEGDADITIDPKEIDGKYPSKISFTVKIYPDKYLSKGIIADKDENGESYLHYYLGEKVNLTTNVSNWKITNRKGGVCNGIGNVIPTGSNISCGNLPLPVFLVQGPVNMTLNYDKDKTMQSNQVIFIDPYFANIIVSTSFRG